MDKCLSCRYWKTSWGTRAASVLETPGNCRRHAPIVKLPRSEYEFTSNVWPEVDGGCWCGDWQPVTMKADDNGTEQHGQ